MSDSINNSNGVNKSDGVNWSDGVNKSYGVNLSDGVNKSYGVNWSDGVNKSYGGNKSYGVNLSDGVNKSYGVNKSDGVNWSDGVNKSYGVNLSDGVNKSSGVNKSYGVNKSDGVNKSYGILNCYGVDNAIFLLNKKRSFFLFGKEISKERFDSVWFEIKKLNNGWAPVFNNIKSLYLQNGSKWEKTPIQNAEEISKQEAWSEMPQATRDYIASLPEFDSEMFLEITGIDMRKPRTIKITHEGQEFKIDIEKAKEIGILK